MTAILAIDPGASGGLAWLADGIVTASPMPEGMTAQVDLLLSLSAEYCDKLTAIIENVGHYMPGNSGPAAATFARHCGHLEAALYCLGVPMEKPVAPQTWQKALGPFDKDKATRKKQIKEAMARKYPHLSVTLKTADALGILTWYIEHRKDTK
jgi:hypothetical protein